MKKIAIPFLIFLMVIALSGITLIQVVWIKQSIKEKQSYIDNLVQQAIANVDHRLSSLNTLSVFHNQSKIEITDDDSLLVFSEFDSLITFNNDVNKLPKWQSNEKTELQIISVKDTADSNRQITTIENIHHLNDSIAIVVNEIATELNELNEVRTIIEQIKIEKTNELFDWRLDSNYFSKDLKKELRAFNLDTSINFGVFDSQTQVYTIYPKDSLSIDYEIPLFKNDFLNPGRFVLHLSLTNNNSIIWRDIKTMVALSTIFLIIILSVFIYAIRLIIKHKKISAIKSDFINNMTHEFKTPLATISLAADSIIHENIISSPEKIKSYAGIIQQEKNKLNENVERILEIAKLEKDQVIFSSDVFIINSCVEDAINSLKLLLASKNGTIEFNAENKIQLTGDKFHLTQAIKNMLENSIKYCNQNPQIKINLLENKNGIILSITDNGIGMTQKLISKIFEPFYRGQSGDIHDVKGFGLGLSYSQSIIHKMKGKIEVNSKINVGTSIEIKFNKS